MLPVVLRARLLYSKVCQARLDWDQILNEAYRKRSVTWSNELINPKLVRIPQCLKPIGINPPQIQLHFFADASALARGAVCYLRAISKGVVTCSLVMAKSHVCTPGKNTIPRLELEAVKLSIVVKQELDLSRCPCLFWSDSTIVLQSLQTTVKIFSIFKKSPLENFSSYRYI